MFNDPTQWTVLIVDDEIHNLGVAEYVLRFHDAKSWKVTSGRECLEMLGVQRPTFILLDIQMPLMSGFEVLEAIRQNARLRSMPVIAMTSYAMPGDYERAMAAGFDGYITKPIQVATFIKEITAILNNSAR